MPSSSTSQIQPPVDVGKEREASIHRLLGHWASLAERYTRRLDEDDIVDLQTGEVTRDYGILRNSRKCKFGALAAPPTEYLTSDEDSDSQEDEDDVYDPDELDAFADTYSDTDAPEVGTQYDLESGGKVVPPVPPLHSADAADLQEFMDAEQRRREMCGSDFGEEEESGLDDPLPEAFDDQTGEDFSGLDELDQNSNEEGEECISEGEKDYAGEGEADGITRNFVLPPIVVDSTSEDELDVWKVDETNGPGPVLNQADKSNNSDSDIEIIEPPTFFTPSKPHPPVPPKNKPTRNPSRIPHQLHTPPQSHASSGSSLTPMRDQSLDTSKNYSPSRTSNDPVTPSLSQPHSPSEHSYPETPTKKAIPRLNLALLSKTPGKLSKELPHSSPVHAGKSTAKPNFSLPNPKLKPIVLLTPRKSEERVSSTPHSIQPHHHTLKNVTEEQRPFKSSKGKQRALEYNDHEAELSSPSKSPKRRGRPRKSIDIVVDSKSSTKLPAIQMQTPPSKRITQDAHLRPAPSNEDSDDPILISPPSHQSSHPDPVEEVSLLSETSTSSRHTRESYLLPSDNSVAHKLKPTLVIEPRKMASPGLRKRKRTISDLTAELSFGQSPEKRMDRKDSPNRHTSSHASSSRFIDGKLELSLKAIY